MALEERFQAAAKKVSEGGLGNLSQNDQLDLYGLYAVIKKGAAPTEGPSAFLDPRGFAKWTAWATQSHLSNEEAMQAYVELVAQLESGKSSGGGSGSDPFGTKVSTFTMTNGDDEAVQEDICYYATKGDVAAVRRLLQEDKNLLNFRDADGLTPLMRAVDRNEEAVMDLLVDSGADLNATDADGQTALHYAAYCEHAEIAGALVLHGAQTDIKDADGMTAVDAATGETKRVLTQAIEGSWKRPGKGGSAWIQTYDRKEIGLGIAACIVVLGGLALIRYRGRSR